MCDICEHQAEMDRMADELGDWVNEQLDWHCTPQMVAVALACIAAQVALETCGGDQQALDTNMRQLRQTLAAFSTVDDDTIGQTVGSA